jgi:hypothetical protein
VNARERATIKRAMTVVLLLVGIPDSIAQPTPSGPARGKTCSDIDRECVRYDFGGGEGAATELRCQRYKNFCLRTGVYHDGRRTITGVLRE